MTPREAMLRAAEIVEGMARNGRGLPKEIAAEIRAEAAKLPDERRAPVQGYRAGIPWSMHLRAYDAYSKRYSPQPALIEGGCRGGFDTAELDMFIPGWREELSELTKLKAERDALAARVRELEQALRPFVPWPPP